MWKDMLGRDTSITMLYGSLLNGILLQSWIFWILSMKKQINGIMRASILSLSAPHGSGEGTEGQTCWTHHTRAGWRLLSIKLDFAAQGQGRNNYTVPVLPEVLLAGEKWGVGGAQPASPPGPLDSAWGWAVPVWKPPQKWNNCTQRQATNLTRSWDAKSDIN